MNSQPPRIPGDQVNNCRAWLIPEIDGDNILPSAEKEEREHLEREAQRRGEVLGEDVDSDEINGPITAAELAKITEQAHQEGYAAGFEQGHGEGLKQGQASGEQQAYSEKKELLDDHLQRLAALVDGLNDPFEQETGELLNLVLSTVTALAEAVVERELKTSPLEIAQFVEMALAALPATISADDDSTSLQLHPDDIAVLQEYYPNKAQHWPLSPNTDLRPGGVVVRHRDCVVNLSLEKRLQTIAQQFLNGELQQALIKQDSKDDAESSTPDDENLE